MQKGHFLHFLSKIIENYPTKKWFHDSIGNPNTC